VAALAADLARAVEEQVRVALGLVERVLRAPAPEVLGLRVPALWVAAHKGLGQAARVPAKELVQAPPANQGQLARWGQANPALLAKWGPAKVVRLARWVPAVVLKLKQAPIRTEMPRALMRLTKTHGLPIRRSNSSFV
jgi:hypothetical protein